MSLRGRTWAKTGGFGNVAKRPMWAHVDLNHGPHPYQGCALTGLSYGPQLVVKDAEFYRDIAGQGKSRIVAEESAI